MVQLTKLQQQTLTNLVDGVGLVDGRDLCTV